LLALAVGDVPGSAVPNTAVGEINFRDVQRGVSKCTYAAVHCEVVLYLHARTESALVHDALRVLAVVYQERHGRGRDVALVDERQRDVTSDENWCLLRLSSPTHMTR
jgi:hypothetical protein